MMRALLAASLCAGWVLHGADLAHAQAYPNKPIKVVVPFPPGGPTDGMARIISDRLGAVLGQSIVIENRGGGAGGSIGAKFVATADPDGYTILITPGGSLTTGPAVHPNIGYDPVKVFAPVGQLIETPLIISVHPDLPVKSMAELVAYAKANPGKISWGSQGFGTAPHLLAEMFKLEAGVNILHVPYRGTAPMLTAILAGEVQIVADPMTTSLPHIQAGKLRPIAIAGAVRIRNCPTCRPWSRPAFPSCRRRSGSPWWRRPERRPPSSTSSTARSAKASPPPETRARLDALGAEIKIGTPAGSRQDARRRARAVDRRRQGRQHQGGMRLHRSPGSCRTFVRISIEIP